MTITTKTCKGKPGSCGREFEDSTLWQCPYCHCTLEDKPDPNEPTDLEYGILDRINLGVTPFGPLTLQEQESVCAYDRYCLEAEAEHIATEQAGGRTVCPSCKQRKVVHRTVCTYGYEGHPGADYSDYGKCENCGHEEF